MLSVLFLNHIFIIFSISAVEIYHILYKSFISNKTVLSLIVNSLEYIKLLIVYCLSSSNKSLFFCSIYAPLSLSLTKLTSFKPIHPL